MLVRTLNLVNFRNYAAAHFEFVPGITAVLGDNGQGKTNVAEALAYLATLDSFRGAPPDALIRSSCETAIIRAEIVHDDGRELLVEAEINRHGRNRVLVNRQRLTRSRELLGVLRVTVFSPDDLAMIKEGPSERRRFMDDALVAPGSEARCAPVGTRSHSEAAQQPVEATRWSFERGGVDHARRVGREAGDLGRVTRAGAGSIGKPGWRRRLARPMSSWPAWRRRSNWSTSRCGVGRGCWLR